MKRLLILSAFVLCLLALLTACGPQTAYSRDEVMSFADDAFAGKVELVSETPYDDSDDGDARYTLKSQYGFDFNVHSSISMWEPIPVRSRTLTTDYNECLLKAFESNIKDAAAGRNIDSSISNSTVNVSVSDLEALDDSISFLSKVYDILSEMIVDKAPDNNPIQINPVRFRITKSDAVILIGNLSEVFSGFNAEEERYLNLCAKISFVKEAQDGRIQDFTVTEDIYAEIPREVITELYINTERFESEKYTPKFYYGARNNEYMVCVGYGIELEYNGGVRDEMQREIVENYLGGSYHIDNDSQKSFYTIGSDRFEVKCPRNSKGVVLPKCEFRKNGKLLDIKARREPQFWGGKKASYFFYLSLSDYAELLNMDWSVDNMAGVVYLTSRS